MQIMKIDTHVHTVPEKTEPFTGIEEMMHSAGRRGLDGFIVTEHNALPDRSLLEGTAGHEAGMRIFRGIEISCGDGFHYLVYGPLDFPVPEPETSPEELFGMINRRTHFISLAHPYRRPEATVPRHVYELRPDAVEVQSFNLQSPLSRKKSLELAWELECHATAGTDHHPHCPRLGKIGIELKKEVSSDAELVLELKAGRFRRFSRADF